MIKEDKQVGHSSIDLRLGTEFIVTKRTNASIFDPLDDINKMSSKIAKIQERIYIGPGQKLVLHPNNIVLGCTLEYLRLPTDLLAYVIGRSSWGRLGLVIATATLVHPGYTGIITLEMTNLGDTPIALYPGVRIAQLVLHRTGLVQKNKKEYVAKMTYRLATRPSYSRINEDEEWTLLSKIKVESELEVPDN